MKSVKVPAVSGFEMIGSFAKLEVGHVCWPDGFPYRPEVNVRIGHSASALLIRFDVSEKNAKAITTVDGGPVWEDSCVEFFVQLPDSGFYYNFETNCIGTGLAAKRRSKTDAAHFTQEQMSLVLRRSSLPHKPLDIADANWSMELEIPFSVLGCTGCPERLLANFYKCGDKTAVPHFLSWNPVGSPTPNFHLPEYFGELILVR